MVLSHLLDHFMCFAFFIIGQIIGTEVILAYWAYYICITVVIPELLSIFEYYL